MISSETLSLSPTGETGPAVSSLLLGVNLEMAHFISAALMANRIRNPKFGGPADPQTGVVPDWLPFGMNMGGMHAKAIEGMYMSPSQCQMLHNYSAAYGAGIVQAGIPIRKGETLEFKIWAKCRHTPVKLLVSLRAQPSRAEDGYANAEIVVDTAYWKCFTVEFPISHTDEDSILFILVKDLGVVLIDQVSLEPKDSSGVDLDVQEGILRLNPSAIRFPGGCMSTNHHWRHGTGPRELRPSLADPVFKSRTDYDFGTDEYLELCRILGNTPHIVVNIGSGTPQDAADWAAYCHGWFTSRGVEPPLAYFQMGNEQYGPWETAHMSGEMYAAALREFIPGVRQAYPNCRIIALAEPVSTGVARLPDTPFRHAVLDGAAGLVDVLALNRYKGQWYDDPADQLQNAVDSVGKIRADLEALVEEARLAGWTPRIALTEWNYWLHAAHWDGKNFYEPDDAFHGIFFSGVIHLFIRMSEHIEIASYYHLLNAMGLVVKSRAHVTETAIGALYRLYRSALPGKLLPLDKGLEELPCVDAVAVTHDGVVSLFLSHWGQESSPEITLDAAFGHITSCQTLAATDCYSPMKARSLRPEDRRLILPPLSVTKVEFSVEAGT